MHIQIFQKSYVAYPLIYLLLSQIESHLKINNHNSVISE